jgi:hypothetical protein
LFPSGNALPGEIADKNVSGKYSLGKGEKLGMELDSGPYSVGAGSLARAPGVKGGKRYQGIYGVL